MVVDVGAEELPVERDHLAVEVVQRAEAEIASLRQLGEAESALRRALDSDVFYSFRRSPVVIVAAIVTLAFFAGAVFAPLIANDAPYFARLRDVRGFEASRALLEPLAREVALMEQSLANAGLDLDVGGFDCCARRFDADDLDGFLARSRVEPNEAA